MGKMHQKITQFVFDYAKKPHSITKINSPVIMFVSVKDRDVTNMKSRLQAWTHFWEDSLSF